MLIPQLNRVRLAEDRFLRDVIDAEYASEGGEEDGDSGDELGRRMKAERKDKARRSILAKSRAMSNHRLAPEDAADKPAGESCLCHVISVTGDKTDQVQI